MMCFLSCFHHGVGVKDLTLLHWKSIKYINLFWLYLLPQLHRRDEELSEENQQYLFGKYATCRCIIAFHDLKTSRQWYRSGWLHKNVHLPAPAKSCPWGSDANRAEESKVPFGALQSSCAGSPGCTPNGSLVALTCCFLTWSLSPFVTHSAPVCHPHLYSWSQQLWWDYFMIICMVPVCISWSVVSKFLWIRLPLLGTIREGLGLCFQLHWIVRGSCICSWAVYESTEHT